MCQITLGLVGAVVVLGIASCSITCPDGSICSDSATCCEAKHGYICCQYPKAVCCSDQAHCCPSGFACNMATHMCERQNLQRWMSPGDEPCIANAEGEEEEQTNLAQSVCI